MKRYYLSKIIGDGKSPETAFKPKIGLIPGLNYVSEIKTDPATGVPVEQYALCMAAAKNHSAILSDTDNRALPDVPLDVKMNAINAATKSKFVSDLAFFGIDSAFVNSSDGFRDSVRHLGKLLNTNFDENNFDVSE